ncbi:DNA-directed RNA polymerases II, IV and V subunit 6A-like [Pyrus ussuriensis x Pyrus communis]|uniref:DNA-directed RNA polymerases II, IV and V subunit 6A-like n=1 Tax=Pyrus ussuriensis x Pyrus communis TaxID=2448454 RepID=A0A5N5IE13_9ROSA|nr:DNA-directed RNA polymerases II, IV and V subunit 6A-like [Pyrus ussuriensis x Pyrus communis]
MSISLYLSSAMGTSTWLTGDFYVPLKEKNKQHQPHLIISGFSWRWVGYEKVGLRGGWNGDLGGWWFEVGGGRGRGRGVTLG